MSIVYIVSAPSGSGKSTLVNELFKMVSHLDFSISYTTRPPRGSEQNGKEYFFVSQEEFEAMIAADEFLEYATVFGNYYGTARRFLRDAENRSNDLLLDIDVQGASKIKEKIPEAVSIFILPPDREKLEWRLHPLTGLFQTTSLCDRHQLRFLTGRYCPASLQPFRKNNVL